MRRSFAADVVLTVYSGRHVCGDFGLAHELMDHFYPGIMTIGVAAMQPTAAKELERQFPVLAKVPEFAAPWEEWRAKALAGLPATFDVEGGHQVGEGAVGKAFDDFMSGVRR